MGMGVLGAYIGRIYDEAKRRPKFIVDESLGLSESVHRLNRGETEPAPGSQAIGPEDGRDL
jgi:hypothetical protein